MSDAVFMVLLTSLTQTVASLLLALVFGRFYGIYRRRYLRQWAWSWWASCAYRLGSAIALYAASSHEPVGSISTAASALALSAAYLQVAWLLFGTFEVASDTAVPRRLATPLLTGLAAFGPLSVFALSFISTTESIGFGRGAGLW